jgi:hypothetical protein
MLRGLEETSEWTVKNIGTMRKLQQAAIDHARKAASKIDGGSSLERLAASSTGDGTYYLSTSFKFPGAGRCQETFRLGKGS